MMVFQDEKASSQTVIEALTISENSQQDRFIHKLQAAIRQLGEVIDEETQALSQHKGLDFNNIKTKKARSLQILTQLLDDMGQVALNEESKAFLGEPLGQLNDKLARNGAILKTHMEAVSELVEMINSAAHAQETDGTYNPYLHAKQAYKGQSQ